MLPKATPGACLKAQQSGYILPPTLKSGNFFFFLPLPENLLLLLTLPVTGEMAAVVRPVARVLCSIFKLNFWGMRLWSEVVCVVTNLKVLFISFPVWSCCANEHMLVAVVAAVGACPAQRLLRDRCYGLWGLGKASLLLYQRQLPPAKKEQTYGVVGGRQGK